MIRLLAGDCRDVLATLPADRVRADAPLFADMLPVPSEDGYDRDMRDLFQDMAAD
jgi:hypothetical protein